MNNLIEDINESRLEEESSFLNSSQNFSILGKLYQNTEPILQTIQLPTIEHSECLMKIYQKLKFIYKSFVVLGAGKDLGKGFLGIEKELNDALELVSLYLNV